MSGSEQDTTSDGEETTVPATETTRRSKPQPSSILQNLTYVEEAIPKFSGTDPTYTVSKWAQEVEDNTIIFGLTPVQKILIARRTLKATAASWLRMERPFPSYEELKKAISKEFPDFINTKKIHEIMSKRSKRKDESCYEYMLEMKTLGKRGKLTDVVTIEYIVDGIKDLETNKMVLYGTKSFSELKERIKIYESLKQKQNNKGAISACSSANANATNINSRRNHAAVRCYSCGQFNHTSAECPQRDKGRKCFRCNEFGHIGSQCSAGATSDKKRSSYAACQCAEVSQAECHDDGPEGNVLSAVSCIVNVNVKSDSIDRSNVNNKTKNKSVKEVIINGLNVMCLVDSGSDLNLISSDLFFQLGVTKFERDNVTLSGCGDNNRICSLGKFDTNIELDVQNFVSAFHIVPHYVMPYKLILGQEFLSDVVVVIRQGKVTVMPPQSHNALWTSQVYCSTVREESNHLISDPTLQNDNQEVPTKTKECYFELKKILTDDIPVASHSKPLSIKKQKRITEWSEHGTGPIYKKKKIIKDYYIKDIPRKIKINEDFTIYELLQHDVRDIYSEERANTLQTVTKLNLQKKDENGRNFNGKKKKRMQYQKDDLVAIREARFGTCTKSKPKFLGPYRVVKLLGNDRYEVEKVSVFEGPNKTSTAADFMKKMPDGCLV